MVPPKYQPLVGDEIPVVNLADGIGHLRVIAGTFESTEGPAHTYSPINIWDARFNAGASLTLTLLEGHTTLLVVLSGCVTVHDQHAGEEAEVIRMTRAGADVRMRADADTMLLVLTGESLGEPVVGYGPFVMNSHTEIVQAVQDYNAGLMGR
jgi:redox-sensitive bicupin YhaK (pirin superfamily)